VSALRIIITGSIVDGLLLALIAAGFVVVYRATKVISFCQGLFMVLGALIYAESANKGFGLYGSLVVAVAVTGVIGAALFRLVLARVVGAEPIMTAIATIGVATAGEAICILIWSDQQIALESSPFSTKFINVFGAQVTEPDIFIAILTIVLFVILILGIQRSSVGLRMRAVADHPRLAAYNGVNVSRLSTGAWAVAAIAGALAGAAFVLTSQPTPDSVYGLGLAAFPAILLGGFDSIPGAIVGGLLIGFVEDFTLYFWGGEWEGVVAYLVLLAVLIVRPSGLFGNAEVVRL
jgi:branched-chain amino acid transport system permease protein